MPEHPQQPNDKKRKRDEDEVEPEQKIIKKPHKQAKNKTYIQADLPAPVWSLHTSFMPWSSSSPFPLPPLCSILPQELYRSCEVTVAIRNRKRDEFRTIYMVPGWLPEEILGTTEQERHGTGKMQVTVSLAASVPALTTKPDPQTLDLFNGVRDWSGGYPRCTPEGTRAGGSHLGDPDRVYFFDYYVKPPIMAGAALCRILGVPYASEIGQIQNIAGIASIQRKKEFIGDVVMEILFGSKSVLNTALVQGLESSGMLGYYQTSKSSPQIKKVGDAAEATFGYVLEWSLDWSHTPLKTLRMAGQLCGSGSGSRNPQPPKPTPAGLVKTLAGMFATEQSGWREGSATTFGQDILKPILEAHADQLWTICSENDTLEKVARTAAKILVKQGFLEDLNLQKYVDGSEDEDESSGGPSESPDPTSVVSSVSTSAAITLVDTVDDSSVAKRDLLHTDSKAADEGVALDPEEGST